MTTTDLVDPTRPDPDQPRPTARPPRKKPKGGLFRAAWRWHFYAAFLVTPVLAVLAATGLIYLFRFEIEPLLHASTMKVEQPVDAAPYSYHEQLEAAAAYLAEEYPGAEIVSMTEPREPGLATVFSAALADETARDVYVNPFTSAVQGDINPDTTVSGTAVIIHGELMAGTLGDLVIEVAACWAIVMAITGYYLTVTGRKGRARAVRAGRRGAKLRSWHARSGAVLGVGLLFLLISGLPWTGFWGGQVQQIATAQGSSLWSMDHGAISEPTSRLDESLPHSHEVPWAQGASGVPTSDPAAAEEGRPIATIDTAVEVAAREGLHHPMTIALPAADDGVFSVIGYAFHDPSEERTVHVDRFGGQVVSTYGYDDYPTLAKVVAQGIGLHEGRSMGPLSFWGAALMCLLVLFACVTGPLMWWRRRPDGARLRDRLAAPRGAMPLKARPLLAVLLLALAVLLPAFGITVIAILLLDHLVLRRVPALTRWFDVAPTGKR